MDQIKLSIYRLQAKSVYLDNLKNTIIVSYRDISEISEFHTNVFFQSQICVFVNRKTSDKLPLNEENTGSTPW
jgi:hypothetical protein